MKHADMNMVQIIMKDTHLVSTRRFESGDEIVMSLHAHNSSFNYFKDHEDFTA